MTSATRFVFLYTGILSLSICVLSGCSATSAVVPNTTGTATPYFAQVQVVRDVKTAAPTKVTGRVFHDRNRNGLFDSDEKGIPDVLVSNGKDVVQSAADGQYALPILDDMSVFVIQPSDWQVPTDPNYTPQFSYQHKPAGSPKPLRFGGLPATGPVPSAIHFPLIPAANSAFNCVVLGDVQAYANQDISYFRDSTIDDLLDREATPDCVIAVGDVMGDDLGLIPRMSQVIGALQAPQWWVHGNHDFDFDADFDVDSADSWRRLWGPAYYAFEIGNVLFIALDNVVYPCHAEDAMRPGREFCLTDDRKRYNGRVTEEQVHFVENLLALTPKDKTIVFAHHIPFVSFYDQTTAAHQTDNVTDIYELVAGREVLSISGHTHTIENLAPNDAFAGWSASVGVDALPFRHIIAGAASGGWYQGDLDIHGTPMSLQRMGAPKGWLSLQFDDQGKYQECYHGANVGRERVAWLSLSTPSFRDWYQQISAWHNSDKNTRDPIPPLSINDLPDVKILTPEDLMNKTFITANVWAGASDTQVNISINNMSAVSMARTQQAQGESAKIGVDFVDPFAAQRQLSVARIALQSRSGIEANQGYQVFKGIQNGPTVPQPQRHVTDRNVHLWRYELPANLPLGTHVATVTITDRHGQQHIDTLAFEVVEDRPNMRFRKDVWEAFSNGAPVRKMQ